MSPEEYFNEYFPPNNWNCRNIPQFHLDIIFRFDIESVCRPDDWKTNNTLAWITPLNYRQELINMVAFGFTLKEAYDLLKEAYNFN